MIQATVNGSTTNYKYDAFGRRVAQQTPNGTNYYFHDMGGRLLATYPWINGNQQVRKAYFAGQRVGQYTDRVGSTRYTAAVPFGGDPPFIYTHYYPFGEEITSTANDRYKFAETFRDADSGLDYAMNRYYASGIGRFLSVDSAEADPMRPQSFNRYAYAENDPANFNDPTGTYIRAPLGCFYFSGSLVCAFQPVYSRPRGGYQPGPADAESGQMSKGEMDARRKDLELSWAFAKLRALELVKKYSECAGLFDSSVVEADMGSLVGAGYGQQATSAVVNRNAGYGNSLDAANATLMNQHVVLGGASSGAQTQAGNSSTHISMNGDFDLNLEQSYENMVLAVLHESLHGYGILDDNHATKYTGGSNELSNAVISNCHLNLEPLKVP
jgi:RHS repeat-associated protein